MQHLPETGLGNPVTAVLIAYRAFDTMLEKVVLVLAVVGVWSLAADRYWGGAPGEARAERPEADARLSRASPGAARHPRWRPHLLGRRR